MATKCGSGRVARGRLSALACAVSLGACSVGPTPRNLPAAAWMPEEVAGTRPSQCRAAAAPSLAGRYVPPDRFARAGTLLAPGDRLRLRVAGDKDVLTGIYVVGADGAVQLPGVVPSTAAGLWPGTLGAMLSDQLARARLIRATTPVSIELIELAGVPVSVSGAVFEQGTVAVGERSAESRGAARDERASGDANGGRSLATALRAAGGVRPDADLAHVRLARGVDWTEVDLRGALDGTAIADIQVTAGDRIAVPSTGCFDAALVRPSPVTAPGIRVYLSNLSRPAPSNATSAIGKESTSLPYGTRLLQTLVDMNCVGGSAMNARRRAVLISRNPMTGQSVVIEREVESLVRAPDRDRADPWLMPADSVACYDSRWMRVADVISLLGSAAGAATPALLLRNATR